MLGLEIMCHPSLCAWSTLGHRAAEGRQRVQYAPIINGLLTEANGRLMVMNDEELEKNRYTKRFYLISLQLDESGFPLKRKRL